VGGGGEERWGGGGGGGGGRRNSSEPPCGWSESGMSRSVSAMVIAFKTYCSIFISKVQ
jgi:hypothetical protein